MEYQVLSYRFRLLPTKRQHVALRYILEEQRALYNAALEERIGCYKKTGKNRTYIDQCKAVTELRKENYEFPLNLQRWTLKKVEESYKAFFRRLKKKNGKVGFPRFKGKEGWKTFGFNEIPGLKLKTNRLQFKGMPGPLRMHMHRQMPENADIRSCTFTQDLKGWYVSFQVKVPCAEKRTAKRLVGIDVGLKEFAVLSDQTVIPNPRFARKAEKQMRIVQRKLARAKRGSKGRARAKHRLAVLHRKIANTRKTFLHQTSAALVKNYDGTAVEELKINNMVHTNMARSIHDASWGMFYEMLKYKAARAGTQYVAVDPHYTSQLCSGCGGIAKKSLKDRVHECLSCGLVLDRDHNAAINILERGTPSFSGVLARKEGNVEQWFKRSPENINFKVAA